MHKYHLINLPYHTITVANDHFHVRVNHHPWMVRPLGHTTRWTNSSLEEEVVIGQSVNQHFVDPTRNEVVICLQRAGNSSSVALSGSLVNWNKIVYNKLNPFPLLKMADNYRWYHLGSMHRKIPARTVFAKN